MSEELKIELGEPIPNSFDYTLTPAELDKQLSEKMALVRSGQLQATHEFTMLGYALDFIDFAQQNVNIAINFDEENLVHLCSILGLLKNSFARNPPPNDIMASYVKAAAGFFGVMIIKNLGGNWVETSAGMSVSVNGTTAFITNRIAGILSGADENENAITEIYGYLKTQSGAANAE